MINIYIKPRPRYIAPWLRTDLELNGTERKIWEELQGTPAIYHCVSRVVDFQRIFGATEKEHLANLIRNYANFAYIKVLAYCVMADHFHVLIEVPEAPEGLEDWSDDRLFEHIAPLYSEERLNTFREELGELRANGLEEDAEEYRRRFFRRIADISRYMHDLKMRFSHWYNSTHNRWGTLWAANFRSVLIQPGHAATLVAAYIDLNPVRSKLVENPEDYRWCSYGEAVAGSREARQGIMAAVFGPQKEKMAGHTWEETVAIYRRYLVPDEKSSAQARANGKKMSEAEMIRHRVRHFLDGLVIGTEDFVEKAFQISRDHFGPRRRTGARKIHDVDTELRALRDLRFNAIIEHE